MTDITPIDTQPTPEDHDPRDPMYFLRAIMGGQDPRELSALFNLIEEITEFGEDELPTLPEWLRLTRLVKAKYRHHPVSLLESQQAANTLMRHVHPTLKQIHSDINTTDATPSIDPVQQPLTLQEIQLFKQVFNAEFG